MKRLSVHMRWLIRNDMPTVLRIENDSFDFAWTEDDFLCALRQKDCIGMVAEYDGEVVGFMVYQLHANKLSVLNLAVDPQFRRRGIGSQMVGKLKAKLSCQRRESIELETRESNLASQLFFRSENFRAVAILHGWYEETNEDAYTMRFNLGEETAGLYANRLSAWLGG